MDAKVLLLLLIYTMSGFCYGSSLIMFLTRDFMVRVQGDMEVPIILVVLGVCLSLTGLLYIPGLGA